MAFYGYSPENFKTDLSHFSNAASMFGQAAGFIPQIKEQRESLEFEENLNEKSTASVAAFSSALSESDTVVNSWMKNVIGLDESAEGFNEDFTKKYHETMGGEPTDVILNKEEIATVKRDMFRKYFDDNVYDESLSMYGGRGDGKLKRVEMNQAYVGRLGNNIQNFLTPIMTDIEIEGDLVSAMNIAMHSGMKPGGMGELASPAGLKSMIVDTQNMDRFSKDAKITNANPESMTPTQYTDYLVQNKYKIDSLGVKSAINKFTEQFNTTNQSKVSDAYSGFLNDLVSETWMGSSVGDIDKKDFLLNSGATLQDALKNYDEKHSTDKEGNPVPDYMTLSDRFGALPEKSQDNLRQNFEIAKKDYMSVATSLLNGDMNEAITKLRHRQNKEIARTTGGRAKPKNEIAETLKTFLTSSRGMYDKAQARLIDTEGRLSAAKKDGKPEEIGRLTNDVNNRKRELADAQGKYEKYEKALQSASGFNINTGEDAAQLKRFKEMDTNKLAKLFGEKGVTAQTVMNRKDEMLPMIQELIFDETGISDVNVTIDDSRKDGVDLLVKVGNHIERIPMGGLSLLERALMLEEQKKDMGSQKTVESIEMEKRKQREGLGKAQVSGAELHKQLKLDKTEHE